jgi:hypothetical protein
MTNETADFCPACCKVPECNGADQCPACCKAVPECNGEQLLRVRLVAKQYLNVMVNCWCVSGLLQSST